MTPDQQARERLAREATPGPWVACLSDRYGRGVPSRAVVAFFEAQHGCQRGLFTEVPWPDGEPAPRRSGDADAKHIAANSPSVILADLARLRALEAEVARLRRVLGGLPSRFEVERLFGGACCERLLVPNGTGGVVFCDLLQDHIGSHEGADDKGNRWWFNESGAGILRTTHPTTGLPLEANRQIFASVHNRTLAALDAALHAQDTEVGR